MRNNPHFFPRKSALPSIASERSRGRRQCFLQFTIRVHRCPSVVKKSMWEKVGRAGKWCEKVGKPHPNPGKICPSVPPFPTSVLSGSILEDASAAAKLAQTCDLSFFYILDSEF